ncbi:hypothetical protein B0H10DRAFT_2213129 [Mycena sp. CBHHK59/15]|nr:hypothetical protein B0H10DRAFT_2213129 [Mycena sp. CBHHK59/15]
MPLFKTRPESPEPAPAAPPQRKPTGGLLSRRSPSPVESDYRSATSHASVRSGFFFPRRRASDGSLRSGATHTTGGGGSSFLGLNLRKYGAHNDPQVLIAREKVATAEEAEKEADRALLHARARVREALQHIKALEAETKEEALRAKAKQVVAKLVSKDARGLGRHG